MGGPRRFHAPGRVNLIGSHVDFSDGLVLPMALQFGTTVVVTSFGGSRVRLRSMGHRGIVDVPADGSVVPASVDGWPRYATAVVAALAHRGRPPAGLEAEISSTLPEGVGLSSSAALLVALGLSLAAAAEWPIAAVDLALACRDAEVDGVGVPVGVMDQMVSALGSPTGALLIDCRTLDSEQVDVPDTHHVVVVDSGATRRLADGTYRDRRGDVDRGVALLGRSLRDATEVDVERLPEPLRRRCRHVVTEIGRVRAVVDALRAGDIDQVGRLFGESYRSDVEDWEAGHPAVDAVVAELRRLPGVVGARMTGGGFGGMVVALVEAGATERVIDGLAPRRAFVARPSPGAGEISPGPTAA